MKKFKGCTRINHQFIGWVTSCANKTPETKRRTQSFAASKHQASNFINRWNEVFVNARPALALYRKQCLQAFIYARSNI
jgi:hypothetical protein